MRRVSQVPLIFIGDKFAWRKTMENRKTKAEKAEFEKLSKEQSKKEKNSKGTINKPFLNGSYDLEFARKMFEKLFRNASD